MKVFISTYIGNWGLKDILKILDKNGIRRYDANSSGDGSGLDFDGIQQTLHSCDAYITCMNDNLPTSWSSDAELEEAINWDMPVIAIKTNKDQKDIGTGLFTDRYLLRENVTVFDLSAGASVKDFPAFLYEHVEKCRNLAAGSSGAEERTPDKPYDGEEPHIFISYAHKDKRAVFEVIRELQNNGYRVWYDEGIDPASEWDENIAEHIEKSSYFIAFISGNYINSQNCRDEISFARDLGKDRLLVYLEETKLPAGMAMRLMRLQAIHKYKYRTSMEFYEKLFSAKGIQVAR